MYVTGRCLYNFNKTKVFGLEKPVNLKLETGYWDSQLLNVND